MFYRTIYWFAEAQSNISGQTSCGNGGPEVIGSNNSIQKMEKVRSQLQFLAESKKFSHGQTDSLIIKHGGRDTSKINKNKINLLVGELKKKTVPEMMLRNRHFGIRGWQPAKMNSFFGGAAVNAVMLLNSPVTSPKGHFSSFAAFTARGVGLKKRSRSLAIAC